MKCENCGNENVQIINTIRGSYICEKCGRDTESLFEVKLYRAIRKQVINEFVKTLTSKCDSTYSKKWINEVSPISWASWADAYNAFKDDINEVAKQMKEVGE